MEKMAQKKGPKRERILVLNSPRTMRLNSDVAVEIGFNESIVLLQIEFLISIAGDDNYKDGRWWTYQSLRDLKENYFCWMSLDTISRTLKKLEARNLILIGNYNRRRNDKTQWFALNFDEMAKLESISIAPHERGPGAVRILDSESENVAEVPGNRTTLPETPEMTPEMKKERAAPARPTHSDQISNSHQPNSPKHPAVEAYRAVTHRYPPEATEVLIREAGIETEEELQFWQTVVRHFIACGWQAKNLSGMLDYYRRREIPSTRPGTFNHKNLSGGNQNGRYSQHTSKQQQQQRGDTLSAEQRRIFGLS